MEHKQHASSGMAFYRGNIGVQLPNVKRATKMAEIKFGLVIAYLVGLPLWMFAFIENMDSWKSAALFIVMMIYWMGMIWFGFRRKSRIEKKERMDLRKQELELWKLEQEQLKATANTVKSK